MGFTIALRELQQRPALIVETGSSAWGADSSLLFDSYVRKFGGEFHTVDIRPEPAERHGSIFGEYSTAHTGDSVTFFRDFELPSEFNQICLLYLDSFDLDLDNPSPSMQHGLAEFEAAQNYLTQGSMVLVDDTPIDPGLLGMKAVRYFKNTGLVPGKGTLILSSPLMRDFEILYHHYDLLLQRK